MPVTAIRKTPGVYITEQDAFPPSIVGVETALPVFIGYTEKAAIGGKPVFGKAIKIKSFAEFTAIFGNEFQPVVKVDKVDAADVAANADAYDVAYENQFDGMHYFKMVQEQNTHFNLYASMKLFYDNGGEQCYVLSVGGYTTGGDKPTPVSIDADKLSSGLDAVAEIVGPTMILIPDAVLLEPDSPAKGEDPNPFKCTAYYALCKRMLAQCAKLQDRVAVLDVYGADKMTPKDPAVFAQQVTHIASEFQTSVGSENLSYGMGYFPFLKTTVMSGNEITYKYFDYTSLKSALNGEAEAIYGGNDARHKTVADMIELADPDKAGTPKSEQGIAELNGNLMTALPMYKQMTSQLSLSLGILPPSPAMAGVMAQVDATKGVWNAPANISLNSVIGPTADINNDMQADLNVPLNGKAIDVIRSFPGRGTVPWGARTLMGNSDDWRYIQVRRTMIYIEQSIKHAMQPFVFAANDGKTWSTVISAVSNFLQRTWSQGGLMGNTPNTAFTVECGLGSTMTAQDILEGYMVVEVRVALLRPAEFIELNFKQKMLEA